MDTCIELELKPSLPGLTHAMIAESAAYREDPFPAEAVPLVPLDAAAASANVPADWRGAISATGYAFIVGWETGGQAYYDKVIKGRPAWPGYASGITIGCGYDLGYHSRDEFAAEWRSLLGAADTERLMQVALFRTVAPDRAGKVELARELVRNLADIVVPWPIAIGHFDRVKLPALIRQLYASLAHLDTLHPHCRAALLSLIFNRGASFKAAGERFLEMRRIRAAVDAGSPEDLQAVPKQLRAMKRIWGPDSSLSRRREGEAELFESGLHEMALQQRAARSAPVLVPQVVVPQVVVPLSERPAEHHEDLAVEPSDVTEDEAELQPLSSGGATTADVRWNPRDDEQPDYRHLDRAAAGSTFEFTTADLDLLIKANEFSTKPGKLIFALRGAAIAGGTSADVGAIMLTDQRPDQRRYRCVIGVYDRENGRMSAFPASTVPNASYVLRCFALARQGTPLSSLTGNVLPTGCYTYAVGTHKKGQRGEIPAVLRLSATATGASQVVVLRSLSDLTYDRLDPFLVATPADNLHPGQLEEGFSSAGCLTLPGQYAGGRHSGHWSEFRKAAGLGTVGDGVQFSLMLLTGIDAANAARVRSGDAEASSLRRLRHGSVGDRVAALQMALGLRPDASKLIGPITRIALVERQARELGWADGIYSPAMDGLLGLRIYEDQ